MRRILHTWNTTLHKAFRLVEISGASAARFSRLHHARNRLQVGNDLNLVPAVEKLPNTFGNRSADLHDQPPSGTQHDMRLWNQARDHLDSRGPGEDGVARLELTHLELNLVLFRIADIGRIGNNAVEGISFKSGEQIRLTKLDSMFKLMP